ncbi:MAG: nitronate monooxygenase, partial [Oscillospiraceae bacterium]
GGMSGPAIFPIALRMVYEVYEAVGIPIIGMGGISRAEDVLEMMLAGAAAVQIGAANPKNPYICKQIIEALPTVCEKYGVAQLRQITGGAHS